LRHRQQENDECGEGGCEREWAGVAAIHVCHWFSEDSGNAHAQSLRGLVAIESHCKTPLAGALFLEQEKGVGVNDGIRAKLEREIIAAKLAFVTNMTADPPDGGMEKEECFGKGLH